MFLKKGCRRLKALEKSLVCAMAMSQGPLVASNNCTFFIPSDRRFFQAVVSFRSRNVQFPASSRKSAALRGGILLYAAQAIPPIDAEIVGKGHLWMETSELSVQNQHIIADIFP
jgi:hypothetical protein